MPLGYPAGGQTTTSAQSMLVLEFAGQYAHADFAEPKAEVCWIALICYPVFL